MCKVPGLFYSLERLWLSWVWKQTQDCLYRLETCPTKSANWNALAATAPKNSRAHQPPPPMYENRTYEIITEYLMTKSGRP